MSEHEHYFTAEPGKRRRAAQPHRPTGRARGDGAHAPGIFSPGRPRQGHRRAAARGAPSRRPAATCWTSAAAGDRSRSRWRLRAPAATRLGRGRQRALARPGADATPRSLGLDGVTVRPEDVPGDVRFAAIWSNPPIRVGKAVLHDLLLDLAPAAGSRRRGIPRRAEEPRLGLAAALAGAGPSSGHLHRLALRLGQGLSGSGGHTSVVTPSATSTAGPASSTS